MLEVTRSALEAGLVVAGGYTLERVVGEGGMGVVWAASARDGRRVALKFLHPDKSDDPKSYQRMLREARAARAVQHPNVAEVLDVLETDDGLPFIVMELLDGETLAALLRRRGRVGAAEIVPILLAVARGVEAAQQKGIVHRDLKPDNVFIVREAGGGTTVKVLDFGIAKAIGPVTGREETPLTTMGAMLGTPHYMAPEQLFGDDDVDGRADVWSFGVMLYEALSGIRPTDGTSLGQILKRVTTGLPPLTETAPDAPADLARLTARCLTRERARRPTISEVRDALERHLGARATAPIAWLAWGGLALAAILAASIALVRPSAQASEQTPPRTPEVSGADAATVGPEPSAAVVADAAAVATAATHPVLPPPAATTARRDAGSVDATTASEGARDAAPDRFDIPISDVRK